MLNVLSALPLPARLSTSIQAVSPEIQLKTLEIPGTQNQHGQYWPSQLQEFVATDDLTAGLNGCEILFCVLGQQLYSRVPEFSAAAPNLRWIQSAAAGLPSDERTRSLIESGVTMTVASGVAARPIAEFCLGYMLMLSKGWPSLFRSQQQHQYNRFVPKELFQKTVGIIGMGTIGAEVARLSKSLGCRVLAIRRSYQARRKGSIEDEEVPPSELLYLLAESDFVVLTAPLTQETKGLIGAKEIKAMKRSAYLINVGRGAIVDEPALIVALREKLIAGAALDVFTEEPLVEDSPLWDMENVLLSPHVAGGTESYLDRAVEIFRDNLGKYLAGAPLSNVVSLARGY